MIFVGADRLVGTTTMGRSRLVWQIVRRRIEDRETEGCPLGVEVLLSSCWMGEILVPLSTNNSAIGGWMGECVAKLPSLLRTGKR